MAALSLFIFLLIVVFASVFLTGLHKRNIQFTQRSMPAFFSKHLFLFAGLFVVASISLPVLIFLSEFILACIAFVLLSVVFVYLGSVRFIEPGE